MRLINADGAKAIICKYENRAGRQHQMIYEIEMLPTIEAEPVRHGRWIFDSGVDYCEKCSECKVPKPPHYISDNYCPNCGAKMDAENGVKPLLRPLTWEELSNYIDDAVYLEDVDKDKIIAALPMCSGETLATFELVRSFVTAERSDYLVRWRAWPHRPTDEERAAAKWEVMK